MSILTQLKQQLCEQMAQLHANQGVVALTAEWQLTDADTRLAKSSVTQFSALFFATPRCPSNAYRYGANDLF